MNTGQVCVAIKRCYVHENVYDKVDTHHTISTHTHTHTHTHG